MAAVDGLLRLILLICCRASEALTQVCQCYGEEPGQVHLGDPTAETQIRHSAGPTEQPRWRTYRRVGARLQAIRSDLLPPGVN
jgi:hypothetical protein